MGDWEGRTPRASAVWKWWGEDREKTSMNGILSSTFRYIKRGGGII
jgi:hypothetical protein